VNQAHLQLTAGEHSFSASSTTAGQIPAGSEVPSLTGWDLTTITTRFNQTRTNHYYFTLSGPEPYALTSTLTWFGRFDSLSNSTVLNNLDLILLRIDNNTQQAISGSTVDNVEHLYVDGLTAGRYSLQVVKRGSIAQVSQEETYAVAFSFAPVPEPSTALLLGAGVLALAGRRRRS
jgi:hypothetical protein